MQPDRCYTLYAQVGLELEQNAVGEVLVKGCEWWSKTFLKDLVKQGKTCSLPYIYIYIYI
jgi:hypothetical protein